MKVQKLDIKDENICEKDEFTCEVCPTFCKSKMGLRIHKLTHLTDEEIKNTGCNFCNKKYQTR